MQVGLVLDSIDITQVLDALALRQRRWLNTADTLRTGRTHTEVDPSDDCVGPDEAERTAKHYEAIIEGILKQIGQ